MNDLEYWVTWIRELVRIGIKERRKSCKPRPRKEEGHIVSKIRRTFGMKIVVKDRIVTVIC